MGPGGVLASIGVFVFTAVSRAAEAMTVVTHVANGTGKVSNTVWDFKDLIRDQLRPTDISRHGDAARDQAPCGAQSTAGSRSRVSRSRRPRMSSSAGTVGSSCSKK